MTEKGEEEGGRQRMERRRGDDREGRGGERKTEKGEEEGGRQRMERRRGDDREGRRGRVVRRSRRGGEEIHVGACSECVERHNRIKDIQYLVFSIYTVHTFIPVYL